ncbi:MAG: hypothetical protein U1E47_06430 [Rivihabitans pingtungensis]
MHSALTGVDGFIVGGGNHQALAGDVLGHKATRQLAHAAAGDPLGQLGGHSGATMVSRQPASCSSRGLAQGHIAATTTSGRATHFHENR